MIEHLDSELFFSTYFRKLCIALVTMRIRQFLIYFNLHQDTVT